MYKAKVHEAHNGNKIHGRALDIGDVLAPGDLRQEWDGWHPTSDAGMRVRAGEYVRPTPAGSILSTDRLTHVIGEGGTLTAIDSDMVPHPCGGEPLRGRKLLSGDVVQRGDRYSTEAGWWLVDGSIALGCAVSSQSLRTFVRPAPEPAAAPREPTITYCWAVDRQTRAHLVECRDGKPYRSRAVGAEEWVDGRVHLDSFCAWGRDFTL